MKDHKPRRKQERGFFVPGPVVVILAVILGFAAMGAASNAFAVDWSPLTGRLVADGLNQETVTLLFARPDVLFEPEPMTAKLKELIAKRFRKPLSSSSFSGRPRSLYDGYMRPEVIAGARFFLEQNRGALETISEATCVPKEIVVSIMLVETKLGTFVGSKSAFNTLASMAICSDLNLIRPYLPKRILRPENEEFMQTRCRQKSDWAYNELKFLIDYADRLGADPVSIPGSCYGAIGFCQFMPSNAFVFGVDADEDGRIDLFAAPDALYSIANYLSKNGWKCRMSKDGQYRAILTYNRSRTYANTVLAIAEKLGMKTKFTRGKKQRIAGQAGRSKSEEPGKKEGRGNRVES